MKQTIFALGLPHEAILRAINRYHYLTARQLTRLLGYKKLDYVQEHLKRLHDANLLLRKPTTKRQAAGSTPYVYSLSTKGRKALLQLGIEPNIGPRPSALPTGEGYIEHTLDVSSVLIGIEQIPYVESRIAVATMLHDRELTREPLRVGLPGVGPSSVVPDGFVEVHIDGRYRQGIWIEVDRGTAELSAWKRKIRRIVAASQGPYQEYFGLESLTVAVVTMPTHLVTDPFRRRDTLRRWTETELRDSPEDADLFRFASGHAVEDAEALFLGPNWARPFDRETYPLIELEGG